MTNQTKEYLETVRQRLCESLGTLPTRLGSRGRWLLRLPFQTSGGEGEDDPDTHLLPFI